MRLILALALLAFCANAEAQTLGGGGGGQIGGSIYGGPPPTISACGTASLDANANQYAGTLNITAGAPASCTLTFITPFTSFAHCVVTPETAQTNFGYTFSTNSLVLTATVLSGKIDYFCTGL